MTTESQLEHSSPRENLALWIGILGTPLLWLVQFQINYMLVPWACATGHRWPLHATTALFLVLAAIPIYVARRCQQASGSGQRETSGDGRRRFMAVLGLYSSTLFFLVIVAQGIPSFILDPCLD
jgi:hypothetical protein